MLQRSTALTTAGPRAPRRLAGAMLGAGLALALAVGPVSADHTFGVLDCGTAGTFEVEAASIQPLPKFESPVPWSTIFLLEGTNQVFHAFTIVTPAWTISTKATYRNPHAVVTCTLTSRGLNFESPWSLTGFFAS